MFNFFRRQKYLNELEVQIERLKEDVKQQKEVNDILEDKLKREEKTYKQLLDLQSKEKNQLRQELETKEKVIIQKEAELNRLERELINIRDENQSLKLELNNKINVDDLISCLLPKLDFIRYSVSLVINQLSNPKVLLRKVYQLNTDHHKIKSERVESTKNWKEIHYSTGDGTEGRLYYKLALNGKYQVLVSDKEHQKRDIDYLKKHDR